jgi:hypothetical protein
MKCAKKSISEPVIGILESQHVYSNIDEETKDLVNIASNLLERSNIYESFENAGFDIGREYDWSKRLNQVSLLTFTDLSYFEGDQFSVRRYCDVHLQFY